MGEFFEAFSVDLPKLLFQVINFLLLLYLANRFLFKRVLGLLDERKERIGKGLEDAEQAARDRELARAEREAAVAEARKEAAEMLANANKIATDTRSRFVVSARNSSTRRRWVSPFIFARMSFEAASSARSATWARSSAMARSFSATIS